MMGPRVQEDRFEEQAGIGGLGHEQTRLERGGHRSRYRLRKYTGEPVFGQIKEAQGIRRFLLRGLEKVEREWEIICASHDLRKLLKARA